MNVRASLKFCLTGSLSLDFSWFKEYTGSAQDIIHFDKLQDFKKILLAANGLPAFNSTMLYDRVNGWRIGPEMPYPTFYTHAIMISTHETLLAGGDGSTAGNGVNAIHS